MIRWIRSHADPDECLAILLAGICLWAGWATWNDIIGKPKDAPHLRIHGEVRAFMWWGCAFVSLAALRLPRTCRTRRWAHGFLGVGFMINLRLGSYLASWVASWGWIDNVLPDDIMQGDPRAVGSMWIYVGLDVLVMCLMLAPWSWSYLDKKPMRGGRLEKKERAR